MAAFRFLAWLLVALGIAFLGADAVSSVEMAEPVIRTMAEILSLFGVNAVDGLQSAPKGVANALATLLNLPFWAVLGVLGIVFTLIFRPID
ncbi:MAG: hypothetical protein EVA70_08815 [Parvularculaceae bacterium]|nr:MAG: hypothetical protein EVA70_08815 [Parvularculaceae bacterium]